MNHRRWLPRLTAFGCVLILSLLLCFTRGGAGFGATAGLAMGPPTARNSNARVDVFSNPDTWTTRTDMPTTRDDLGVVAASNGKIYAIGGYRKYSIYFDTVEEYDPATDTWTTRSSMPTARRSAGTVAASNGKIYVIGGFDSSQLDTVEEYDPTTDTWATQSSMPTARAGMGVVATSNGKIYVIGGISGSSYITTVQEYDPATDTWTTRASMPTARCYPGVAEATNGKIYVIGGRDKTSGTFPAVDTVEEYDPTTDTWTTRASMSLPRYQLGVTATSDGKIYAIGGRDYVWLPGYTFYAEFDKVEEYDPATDTWTTRASMPTARAGLGVATASNGKIYAIGGSDIGFSTTSYYNTVEEYTPPAFRPHSTSIEKSVTPQGQVEYGDALTYTLIISTTPGTQVGLYDPLTDTTFTGFVEQPLGVIHSAGAITGTLMLTPTSQMTVSFVTQVGAPITAGLTVSVTNSARVCLVGGTLSDCVWSNEVTNPAFRPYGIYLPAVLLDH